MKNQIENFRQHLISESKSENTIRNYISDVNHFFTLFNTINRNNIQDYKQKILHLSAKTINCKLTSLKSFNEYLLEQGLIESICIVKKDFLKIQNKGNPTEVTDKQVAMFLKRVNEKPNIYKSRNIAIIYLIANTGIRREEICNLKLKSLNFDKGEITGLIGKGNKERDVLLTDMIIKLIKNYLIDRSEQKYANSPYLFISERGEKLHKDTINDIFELYCTPKCRITPHQLRHNYATVTQEQEILTLPELQNQLGHSSLSTVGIYAQARKSSIRKKINKLQIG